MLPDMPDHFSQNIPLLYKAKITTVYGRLRAYRTLFVLFLHLREMAESGSEKVNRKKISGANVY